MKYSFDELVRKQCIYCLRFNPADETCKVSGKKARNTCECSCFRPVRGREDDIVRKKCGDCRFWSNESCVKWPGHYIGENANKICEHFEQADAVNHPNHYTQGGIECVDAMKACVSGLNEMEAACTSHALKYLWRWKHKNGAEDIRKCIWWLERLLKEIDNE